MCGKASHSLHMVGIQRAVVANVKRVCTAGGTREARARAHCLLLLIWVEVAEGEAYVDEAWDQMACWVAGTAVALGCTTMGGSAAMGETRASHSAPSPVATIT